ncbi:hypothetical protein B1756_03665 [Natrarchaeobaculum aegyptiacum]|uniref:Uncharacterized protein n=1 Tax=Natrarchaeobaculum aegyptiacum TaxID=745377 RepID=A0A2Z2HZ64_9EURY|nr:hypothetical protein B1756_03665 [Natrarchaeobaculum aegyptiacum]
MRSTIGTAVAASTPYSNRSLTRKLYRSIALERFRTLSSESAVGRVVLATAGDRRRKSPRDRCWASAVTSVVDR